MATNTHRFIRRAVGTPEVPVAPTYWPPMIDAQGRPWTCASGSFVDAPMSGNDMRSGSSFYIDLGLVGSAEDRPIVTIDQGYGRRFIDTGVGGVVFHGGGALWRSVTGLTA